MNPIEELKEFVKNSNEHEQFIIKKVIRLYDEANLYRNHKICAVCDKELTPEDIGSSTNQDFYETCNEHKEARTAFNIRPYRIKLGFPEERPSVL